MSLTDKILTFDRATSAIDRLRADGNRIVQCHGTFDLVHAGHIFHLEEARALGDALVVTVTSERFVNKGPGRPFFNDDLRAHTLAALQCVDYVILVPYPTAVEAIRCVRPDVYCKGTEYQDPENDVTGNIADDVRVVREVGGEIRYVGAVVFSSTRLINNHFGEQDSPLKQFCRVLAQQFEPGSFRAAVDDFGDLNILVIGDTIFDRYSYLHVQGLTSKNRIISGRYLREETQCGGALAALRHVKQFTKKVKFISVVGTEPWVEPILAAEVAPHEDLILREPTFTTIIKQRFVEPLSEGKEMSKLFSVNYIDAGTIAKSVRERAVNIIRSEIKKADAVLLLDFGHGLMQQEVRDVVQEEAPFLALNCQTNSNNHGFNIISRQYSDVDALSLDQQELMLAAGHRHLEFASELECLRQKLGASYAWLTRGAVQTIGIRNDGSTAACPPLENEIVDSIGAGDAFFSVAALSAARGLPIELGTFLGQLAGAQAVKIVGNASPISKATLLKSGMSLLNF